MVSDEISQCRAELVGTLKQAGCVRTAAIEAAFQKVPRHVFLPTVPVADVYADRSHPVKILDDVVISSSSQPAIMAEMLEQLAPKRNERLLEIGAGSGYNAALLAELVGPQGSVVTIDIDSDVVAQAQDRLRTAGYPRIQVICDDGAIGAPADAPYDGIIVTVGVGDIPAAWMNQLRIGGRLVVPLSLALAPRVVTFERRATCLASRSIVAGDFMAFRGDSSAASIGALWTLGDPAIRMRTSIDNSVDVDSTIAALHGPYVDMDLGISLSLADLWKSLDLWLAINEAAFCRVVAQGAAARSGIVPDSMGIGSSSSHGISATLGVCKGRELALFVLTDDGIRLRVFGGVSDYGAGLKHAISQWDAQGRPSNANLKITAYPKAIRDDESTTHRIEANAAQIICQPSHDLHLQWGLQAD